MKGSTVPQGLPVLTFSHPEEHLTEIYQDFCWNSGVDFHVIYLFFSFNYLLKKFYMALTLDDNVASCLLSA